MPLTLEQLKERQLHIGSSDMGAIAGVSKYRNIGDVYWSKVVELDKDQTEAQMLGDDLEPYLVQRAFRELGANTLLVGPEYTRAVKGYFAANCDAIAIMPDGSRVIIEAKTAGVENEHYDASDWGEDGSREVPADYQAQVQEQMYVHDIKRAIIPALIMGRGIQFFYVDRDDEFITEAVKLGNYFWEEFVIPRVPPPDVPNLETLKRIPRGVSAEARPVALTADLLDEYELDRLEAKAAEEKLDETKRRVIAALGISELGEDKKGGKATYKEQSRRSLDQDRLKEEHPELIEEYTKVSTFRVLRVSLSKERKAALAVVAAPEEA